MPILTEPLPITTFVRLRFSESKIAKVTESWPLDLTHVEAIVIKYLEEMGIFMANATTEDIIQDTIVAILRFAPEVNSMLHKAREQEKKRKEKRHAEG